MIYVQFRKLYADVLTTDLDLHVLYILQVRVLGHGWCIAGIESYKHDGIRNLSHEKNLNWRDAMLIVDGENNFKLSLKKGDISVNRSMIHGGWKNSENLVPGVKWEVVTARQFVSLYNNLHPNWRVDGDGYVDIVTLNTFPRFLRLERLAWGRIHLKNETIAFVSLITANGEWKGAIQWSSNSIVKRISLRYTREGKICSLLLDNRQIFLRPLRVLHDGKAVGQDRVPDTLSRISLDFAMGHANETRWLSSVVTPT